ncbi:MAG TPA: L-2-hydroxyglutarate oxidase [Thermoanaerobaculia bacterium]|nr:L-2-hydroxyglutarate oxidase [Thermoanaerobaculia bacterium]
MITTDFLVIGGGVIGLCVARELKRRNRGSRVIVIDKEPRLAAHASGRNSGVLHAGFYYSPDSLKARFTRTGNAALTQYCIERKLPIRRCGKLVVARTEEELPRLEELHRRGVANGVELQIVSAAEARDIEPRAKVFERAIWSPTTSTVDPLAIMASLQRDAISEGIELLLDTPWRRGAFDAGFVVNAAGLYADVVAREFGFSQSHRILPFKGRYLFSIEPAGALRTHVYPVPDPRFPFLGVHLTIAVDGAVKIGPTAAPAFWREQYHSLDHFRLGEAVDVALRGTTLIASDPALRRHAIAELRKTRRGIVGLAASLADGVRPTDYTRWGKPGIRAQLYDLRRHTLEMDFVIEGDTHSLHILNAVSPGFTCAMPFAEYVVERISGSPASS